MKKVSLGKSFRIVLMACLLLMAMMQAVSAEKVEYKDKNYNFKAIKNVLLYDMDFSDTNIEGVRERSLSGMYEEKAMQEKIPVITPEAVIRKMSLAQGQDLEILAQKDSEAFNDIFDKNLKDYADVYIDAKVLQYETKSIYHPEYTTWETKTVNKNVRDSKGNWVKVEDEIVVPVVHPAYYSSVVYEKIEFHVHDAVTGEEIYSRQEWRDRDNDDGVNMFGRICSAFFKDFHKMIK